MRKTIVRTLSLFALAFIALTAFQNCDAGFRVDPGSGSLSSSGERDLTGAFAVRAFYPGGAELSTATNFDLTTDYEIRAAGDNISSALLTFSVSTASTAVCTLSSVGNLTKRNLRCSSTGSLVLLLRAIWPDESITNAMLTRTVGAALPTGTNSADVTFTIVSGTGTQAWNTMAAPVRVFVGQTLKINNNDSRAHRLHTGGSPFPHQDDTIPVNGSKVFTIQSAHPVASEGVYEHDGGGAFYIDAVDGKAQFTRTFNVAGSQQSCATCHGGIAASNKRGTQLGNLNSAIQNNAGGMGALSSLTDLERRAIVYELNK